MSAISPELTVRRPVYQQDELNHLCKYSRPKVAREYRMDFDRTNRIRRVVCMDIIVKFILTE